MAGHTSTWPSTFDGPHTRELLNAFEYLEKLAYIASHNTFVAADNVKLRGWVYDHYVAETCATMAFAVTTAVHAAFDDLKSDWKSSSSGRIVHTKRPVVATALYEGTTEMAILGGHAAHYAASTSAAARWSWSHLGAVILLALLGNTWLGCFLWPLVSWLAKQYSSPQTPGYPGTLSRSRVSLSCFVIEIAKATQAAANAASTAIKAAQPGYTKRVTRIDLAKYNQVLKSPFRSSDRASEKSKGAAVEQLGPHLTPMRSLGRIGATDAIIHLDVDDVRRLQLAAHIAAAAGTAALAVAAAVRNTYPGLSRKVASAAAAAMDAAGRATALRKALTVEFAVVSQSVTAKYLYKLDHWTQMLELSGSPDSIKERGRGYTQEWCPALVLMQQYNSYEEDLLRLIQEGALAIVDTTAVDVDVSRNYGSDGDSEDTLGHEELL